MPISRLIMPSQLYNTIPIPIVYHALASYKDAGGNGLKIPVNQNVILDAREYVTQKNEENAPNKPQKVIIHACGNGDFHENHHEEYQKQANKYPGCKVVGFNFRNVLKSTGPAAKSEKDWIEDAITIIEYYHNQGVKYSDILLSGHSLGSAIVTMAAAEIYKREQDKAKREQGYKPDCVKLINGRSFKNLASVVCNIGPVPYFLGLTTALILGLIVGLGFGLTGLLGPLGLVLVILAAVVIPLTLTVISPSTMASLYTPVINFVVSCLGFKMDALSAFKQLPKDCKELYYAKHDGIIAGNSGLYAGLKKQKQDEKYHVKQELKKSEPGSPTHAKLQNRLLELRARKLIHMDTQYARNGNIAHNDPLYWFMPAAKQTKECDRRSADKLYDAQVERLLKL